MASVAHSTSGRKLPVMVIASQPVQIPVKRIRAAYPFCIVLGRAGKDPAFCLTTRLLLAIQQDYGATFTDWTAPLTAKDLARALNSSPRRIRTALKALTEGGYLAASYVSLPRGGGGTFQYRLVAPAVGWRGIGDL